MSENFIQIKKCPICNTNEIQLFLETQDYSITNEPFELHQCQNCQFVFTQNIPNQNSIGKYYESVDYISHSDTAEGLINKLYHLGRKYMLNYKMKMLRNAGIGNRVADVGAGTGYFLNHMRQFGYNVHGIEVDSKAREHAKKQFDLDLDDPVNFLTQKDTEYDCITLWHVLEHLHELHEFLDHFKQILSDDGWLIIAVPNRNGIEAKHYGKFWAGYDVPRHLWHFTPENLKELAINHGFQLDFMRFLPLDPFYNAMLSEKYKKSSFSLAKAVFQGFRAWIGGIQNKERASSPVYFFKHRDI